VQNFGTSRDVMIRLPVQKGVTSAQQSEQVITALKAEDAEVTLRRTEFVGPQVGEELTQRPDGAGHGGAGHRDLSGLPLRVEVRCGGHHRQPARRGHHPGLLRLLPVGVLALGAGGVLAVLGYSVNESVVIFDRIREAFRKFRKLSTHEVIDHAITSTMSRTIITHASTEAMVLSMFFFGGPSLHYFALALTIGILFGIYSSVFVAAAIAMWLGVKREDLVKAPAKVARSQRSQRGSRGLTL
jgi:preprotein translocase subunit SecF